MFFFFIVCAGLWVRVGDLGKPVDSLTPSPLADERAGVERAHGFCLHNSFLPLAALLVPTLAGVLVLVQLVPVSVHMAHNYDHTITI